MNYPSFRDLPGPWQGEPDREEFRHAGLDCLVNRGPLGAWCGYVALPPDHPLHGADYSMPDVSVHGGLTYAHKCQGEICHTPTPGESDDVWWFGFDCSHYNDLTPSTVAAPWMTPQLARSHASDVYRDIDYTKAETRRLAEQLAAVSP